MTNRFPVFAMLPYLLVTTLLFSTGNTLAQSNNGHPDLNGTWDNGQGIDFVKPKKIGASICLAGCDEPSAAPPAMPPPDRPSYKPEFLDKVADLEARQVEEDPVLRCLSPGIPRLGPPDKIVQQAEQIIFLYDDVNGNYFRVIPTDGRGHRTDVEASSLGDAIGYWQDETLIVESVNFTDDTWLTDDGSFHTKNLKVIERLKRENDKLHWQAIVYDPEVLTEPWIMRPRIATLTDVEILEAPPCLERDLPLMEDMSHHDNPR